MKIEKKKKVENIVNTVVNVDIGRRNIDQIMEFDELGRLRPKNLGLGPTQESKLTHAPNLGPKLPNLVRSNDHVDSPKKLSHASKISIFEKKIEKKIKK